MAPTNPIVNSVANYYEAQTRATAEIVQAALNGMQRVQRITLQAMRAGTGEQLSLAQSMATVRDVSDLKRAVSGVSRPAVDEGTRYQRELLQAITDMNNEIARASYSMMERMRNALGTAAAGSVSVPGLPLGGDVLSNPMALYDSAMRQWQTTAQKMMDSPSVAMAMASAGENEARGGRASASGAHKAKRSTKRKSSARKR
jgi:phasin family protein